MTGKPTIKQRKALRSAAAKKGWETRAAQVRTTAMSHLVLIEEMAPEEFAKLSPDVQGIPVLADAVAMRAALWPKMQPGWALYVAPVSFRDSTPPSAVVSGSWARIVVDGIDPLPDPNPWPKLKAFVRRCWRSVFG